MNKSCANHPSIMIDLHDRVKLGMRFLDHSLDHAYGGYPNFLADFRQTPAYHIHDFADFGDLTARYWEALLLGQHMTGLKQPDLQAKLEANFFSYFSHPDGLSYRPVLAEPFFSQMAHRPYEPNVAEGFDQSRVMAALITWYQLTRDGQAVSRFNRLVAGLRTKGVVKDDYLYFAQPTFRSGYTPNPDDPPYPQQLYFAQTMIKPLVQWFELTGHEEALHTAGQLARFVTRDDGYFGQDGSFRSLQVKAPGSWDLINGHTHSRLGAVAGLLRYGRVAGDKASMVLGRRAFDWFHRNYCLACGWCPEFIGRYEIEKEGCETCALMDFMDCCIELAAAGYPEYWNPAERLLRNQLLEQQVTDASIIPEPSTRERAGFAKYPIGGDNVLGGFGGWCGVNDFIGNNLTGRCMMHCCGPSGIKAMVLAWQYALQANAKVVRVNMLIPRRSAVADVQSYDPMDGRVEVTARRPIERLEVRLPDWVDRAQVVATVANGPRPVVWQGVYVLVGAVGPGETAVIRYPLRHVTLIEHAGRIEYQTRWIGDTVTAISPPGRDMPLYAREPFSADAQPPQIPDYAAGIQPEPCE
ncbi:MAG: hypothetical protein KJ964_02600 [Verrucomicrobia bacterium]|nr:hypothetical protein [Verrucomicrobiota bacterium]MBU1735306.1 hypothetical protein [Verrucomicrobiota bacterium]MBU1858160.1 hypothetical protein [Verrucomicrobiota bacterium]